MKNCFITRPSLGNPLILNPSELKLFSLTLMGKEDNVPNVQEIYSFLRKNPIMVSSNNKKFELHINNIPLSVKKYPEFSSDYSSGKLAITSDQFHYALGCKWEKQITLGLLPQDIEKLTSNGDPLMLNIRDPFSNKTKHHSIYVHKTLKSSSDLKIFQITDPHIAQRNDIIPKILGEVRTKGENKELKKRYNNFNDNLRSFIKYTNNRVRNGEEIIVVLTGDIIDYYYDGYWDGKFISGQGGGNATNHIKDAPEYKKSGGYSNMRKFIEIITGTDKKGEALTCPIYTILGNHDYLRHEPLLNFKMTIAGFNIREKNSYKAFGLTSDEGREYDYWAFPRNRGKHRSISERKYFKENSFKEDWMASLDQDFSYWVGKPGEWHLWEYFRDINYDSDFRLTIGSKNLLFFNTGYDKYPGQENFALPLRDWERDYINGGPHNQGIQATHLKLLREAINENPTGVFYIFTHAPILSFQKDKTEGVELLFEDNKTDKSDIYGNRVGKWLTETYDKSRTDLIKNGFELSNTPYFKRGKREPFLDFSCADGAITNFLTTICHKDNTTAPNVFMVFSGHTHKVHEFRISKIKASGIDSNNFYYFTNNYSDSHFKFTTKKAVKALRALQCLIKSPYFFTSDGLKNKNPKFREINGMSEIAMKEIPTMELSTQVKPGCYAIALKGTVNKKYFCAHNGGGGRIHANRSRKNQWETFELIELENNKVAIRSYNGKYLRAEGGGGGGVKADRDKINYHEKFQLVKNGNTIALRTHKGFFVGINESNDGIVEAKDKIISNKNSFKLVKI